MDADFFIISNQIFQDLSYLKSLNQVTLEYLVSAAYIFAQLYLLILFMIIGTDR